MTENQWKEKATKYLRETENMNNDDHIKAIINKFLEKLGKRWKK